MEQKINFLNARILRKGGRAGMSVLLCFILLSFGPRTSPRGVGDSADTCLSGLKSVYDKMQSAPKEKTYYLNYTVRTATADSIKNGISVSTIETWMEGSLVQVKSGEMEVYQDEKDVFTVLPQRKLVLWSDPDKKAGKEKRKQMSFIKDTLFSLGKVTECTHEGADKKIVLSINDRGQQMFHISKITFLVRTEKQEIKKIHVDCLPKQEEKKAPNEIAYVEYIFNETDADHRKKKLNDNVKTMFMRSENELNANYKTYKLIDNRHRTNPQHE